MAAQDLRISCGDHSFPLLELEQAIALIGMLECEGFDLSLMGNRSQLQPEQVREDPAGWAGRVGELVAAAGIEVSDVFLIPWTDFEVLAPNHPDAATRAEARALFEDVLGFAARLGAPGVTLVPGVVFAGEAAEAARQRAAAELGWRVERAGEAGLRCSVEPHIGSVAETPAQVLELLGAAPGLELTLDYTHFVARGIAAAEVHPLVPYARHLHARGARPGRGQCPMAENEIDYGEVVAELRRRGYEGFIAPEYVWIEWERMNECDNVSETVLMRDRLRAHIAGRPWRYVGPAT